MLSILCTHRDRDDKIEDFIYHYSSFYPEAEILMLHQADRTKFKKGQLYNIGFSYSKNDIVVFVDIDIRLQHIIDFEGLAVQFKKPFYPYDSITHCEVVSTNVYKILPLRCWQYGPGGLFVYTREQYENVNGHSNLYAGHSWEDVELKERGNPARVSDTVLHINHSYDNRIRVDMNKNKNIFDSRGGRDIQLDGLKQTTHTLVSQVPVKPLVTKYEITNIGVTPDFVYKGLIEV